MSHSSKSVDSIVDLLEWLTTRGVSVEFRWIPAYQGIYRNETVDQDAKDAAQEEMRPGDDSY